MCSIAVGEGVQGGRISCRREVAACFLSIPFHQGYMHRFALLRAGGEAHLVFQSLIGARGGAARRTLGLARWTLHERIMDMNV